MANQALGTSLDVMEEEKDIFTDSKMKTKLPDEISDGERHCLKLKNRLLEQRALEAQLELTKLQLARELENLEKLYNLDGLGYTVDLNKNMWVKINQNKDT